MTVSELSRLLSGVVNSIHVKDLKVCGEWDFALEAIRSKLSKDSGRIFQDFCNLGSKLSRYPNRQSRYYSLRQPDTIQRVVEANDV